MPLKSDLFLHTVSTLVKCFYYDREKDITDDVDAKLSNMVIRRERLSRVRQRERRKGREINSKRKKGKEREMDKERGRNGNREREPEIRDTRKGLTKREPEIRDTRKGLTKRAINDKTRDNLQKIFLISININRSQYIIN